MMNSMDWEIGGSNIFTFLTVGLGVFVLFRIIRTLAVLVPLKKGYRRLIWHQFPSVEIAAWMLFMVWAIQYLWYDKRLLAIVVFIVLIIMIAWIAWFAIKDFVAGAVFRNNKDFNEGEMVSIHDYEGTIKSFTARKLILETQEGETIHLPYGKITHSAVRKINPAELIKHKTFRLTVLRQNSLEETRAGIHRKVMNLPWASIKKSPQVTPIEETNSHYQFEITVYSLETEYLFKIEEYLREKFEED